MIETPVRMSRAVWKLHRHVGSRAMGFESCLMPWQSSNANSSPAAILVARRSGVGGSGVGFRRGARSRGDRGGRESSGSIARRLVDIAPDASRRNWIRSVFFKRLADRYRAMDGVRGGDRGRAGDQRSGDRGSADPYPDPGARGGLAMLDWSRGDGPGCPRRLRHAP